MLADTSFSLGSDLRVAEGPIGAIGKRVAFEMGLSVSDIVGPRLFQRLVRARAAIAWLTRLTTDKSLPQIGRAIGGRDHSTIINLIAKAERLRGTDPAFRRLTDRLIAELVDREQVS